MTDSLRDLIKDYATRGFATDAGTRMHAQLRKVVIDGAADCGDADLVRCIRAIPDLIPMFGVAARTEVPLAGTIAGQFISRRIDRMLVDDVTRTVHVLDYKTDVSRDGMRNKYVAQLGEYAALLRQIYPGYDVRKYILWTHDWMLEQIV